MVVAHCHHWQLPLRFQVFLGHTQARMLVRQILWLQDWAAWNLIVVLRHVVHPDLEATVQVGLHPSLDVRHSCLVFGLHMDLKLWLVLLWDRLAFVDVYVGLFLEPYAERQLEPMLVLVLDGRPVFEGFECSLLSRRPFTQVFQAWICIHYVDFRAVVAPVVRGHHSGEWLAIPVSVRSSIGKRSYGRLEGSLYLVQIYP